MTLLQLTLLSENKGTKPKGTLTEAIKTRCEAKHP